VQRGGTGRLPGEAQGRRQACPIMPSPFRNGRVTPLPAERGTADQREYRSEGVAFATVVMPIRHPANTSISGRGCDTIAAALETRFGSGEGVT
jgi:hypothetical protein